MLMFALAAGLFAADLAAAEKFSLRVAGGLARIVPSDLNGYLADYSRSITDVGWVISQGGLKSFDGAAEFGIAASVPIEGRLSIELAAGWIGARRLGNDVSFTFFSGAGTYRRDDRIQAWKAGVGLTYAFPFSTGLALRPHASLDGIWSSFQDEGSQWFTQEPDLVSRLNLGWTVDARAFNLGVTAGLELDLRLAAGVFLSIDSGWREARLSGFTGTFSENNGGTVTGPRDFRLLYYEEDLDLVSYRRLNISGGWTGGVIRVVRDAVLDLSGLYLAAGLRIDL
jgi:hypothetical protein